MCVFLTPYRTHQLVERDMWPSTVQHEPPGCRSNGSHTHIHPNNEVAEEEPAGDERVFHGAWRLVHDVDLGRVEAQCGCRETVSNQVDPEQLHGNERLGQAQGRRQEDAGGRRRDGLVEDLAEC